MSSRTYPHLADRLLNTPLLLHPQKLDAIIAGLGGRLLGVDGLQIDAAELTARAALPVEMFTTRRGERTERGYRVVDGVAVISAMGGLVHRSGRAPVGRRAPPRRPVGPPPHDHPAAAHRPHQAG